MRLSVKHCYQQTVARCCSLLIITLINACSSTAYIPPLDSNLLSQQQLDVPFYPQTQYYCGPAALAGIFQYHGLTKTPDEIADWVYLPEKKGSLQLEMKAAIRRAELLPYPLSGDIENLLKEISAGNPTLILQNLGFDWWPQWHYAIVVGYDLSSNEMVLHSGTIEYYRINIGTFINTWRRANYWALVPLNPSQLPATATPPSFLKAAADLESTGHSTAALAAYNTALSHWPNEPVATMGIGNINYALKKYAQSVNAFFDLVKIQPTNAAAWNNLAYALHAHGCPIQSKKAIEKALLLSNHNSRIMASQQELQAKSRTDAVDAQWCTQIEPL